ncbi:MAG: sodium:solute symporter [Flavobacteriaceae bacterium]
MMNQLQNLDLIVIFLYLIGIIVYGISKSKRSSSEDYFLGGRTMSWPIVGIALFSANISSSTLVGLASDGFQTNINVYNYEWYAVVILIIFAIFFLPFYLKSGVYTMPEFLQKRYDKRSRYYFSLITIIGNVMVDTAAALYVGSIVLKLLFPEVSSTTIIILLAIAAAAYTIPGGLNSVIQTEVIQAVLLIIGSCLITYFAFDQLGGGWSTMMSSLDELLAAGGVDFGERAANRKYIPTTANEVFSVVRPSNDEFMPWWGLISGVALLGFYFWANNQFMVQRVLGAKDLNHGRWGALFAGFLKLPVIFIMIVPGVLALLLFNTLDISELGYMTANGVCENLSDCPNLTYPVLLFQLLPSGILGLVVAGLLAAMMSSVSATFNSASTLITMDFVKQIKPDLSSQRLVRVGQLSTLILVILASAWVPYIEQVSDSLWGYLQLVIAFTSPPVVSAFVLGLFWKKANRHGAFFSLIGGGIFAVFMILSMSFGWSTYINELHFLAKANLLFAISVLIHIVVSLASAAPDAEVVANFTYKKAIYDQETAELKSLPWYQNYRILAIILGVITVIVVGFFW